MKLRLMTRALLLGGVPVALLLAASVAALVAPAGPVERWLVLASLLATAASAVCAVMAAESVERFSGAMLTALRGAERSGEMRAWDGPKSSVQEMQEIVAGYEHAAAAVSTVQERRRQAYVESVGVLAEAIDARDSSTVGHGRRVSESACAVARAMGLTAQEVERVRVGAVLHDIGKIAVTDAVLRKEGPLTDEEVALMQRHPGVGRSILEGVQGFGEFLDAVGQHHENWDGTGYPRGLKGEETAVEARIIHVADAYDAMTTDRCYRKGMTHEVAIRILWSCAGTQFDPAVVGLFAALPVDALEGIRVKVAQETVDLV